jgi:bilin biosynthesis protein
VGKSKIQNLKSKIEMTQEALFQQLKHPNPHLRDRAMVEIAETRNENTIPQLMAAMGEEDVVYRRAAVKTLGVVGVDAIPSLVDSLTHSDDVTVKGSCAKALAQIAVNYPEITFPDAGIAGLKAGLNDDNPVVHIASAMALGEIGSPALDVLTETLKSTDNLGLAVAVVGAIGSIADNRAVELLTSVAQDEAVDTYVRQSATSALSRLDLINNNKRS